MKRYNQGFHKFGAMEQCDTGEWVKHSDVDSFIKKYGEQHAKVFSELATEMYKENSLTMLKLKTITAILIISIIANGLLLSL